MFDNKSRQASSWLQTELYTGALHYIGAFVLVALAALLSNLFYPLIAPNPFLLFFAAVALSAWYGGLGPSVLAIVLGLIVSSFIFIKPFSVVPVDMIALVRLGGFTLVATLISLLSEARRRVAITAQTQREQLEVTLRSIGDAVIATDDRACLTFLNPVAETLTGWPAAEAVGQPISTVFQIINADTRKLVDNPVVKVLEGNLTVGLANNTLLIARDGTERPIDDSSAPIRSSAGRLTGAILVFRDISAQYQASERTVFLAHFSQLLSQSLDYRQTLQQVADLVVGKLADWCVINVLSNEDAIELVVAAHTDPAKVRLVFELRDHFPIDPHALFGTPHVIRTGQPEIYHAITDGLLRAEGRGEDELRLLQTLGYCAAMIVPLRAREQIFGSISFMSAKADRRYEDTDLAFAQEVANRAALAINNGRLYQAAQAEINTRKRSEANQQLLIKVGTVLEAGLDYEATLQEVVRIALPSFADYTIIHLIDREDHVQRWAVAHADPAKQDLLEELQYKYPIEPKEPNPLRQALNSTRALLTPRVTDEMLLQYNTTDDHLRLMRAIATRSYIIAPMWARGQRLGTLLFATSDSSRYYTNDDLRPAEELTYRIALALDNAQLYQAERQARVLAEAAVQLRDTFLSVAAHELRTPLTSLLLQSQMLGRRVSRDSLLPERDQRMIQAISGQARRLDRMINTMLDISRLENGQLALTYELFDLALLTQRVVSEVQLVSESHPIEYQPPHEPCLIHGDELRIEQVLQNLLQNAIKYSPNGGPAVINLTVNNDSIELTVSDQGIGIPQEALPKIFTRFYRADNVSSERISGLGIGLAVINEIVMLHKGKVTVESEESVGSTFHVYLPRYRLPAEPGPERPTE